MLFSAGLMLSAFKGLESRREGVMRQIQEQHRQTLIMELKRAIEQKDVFMSSVSHELRTPLNGIIGERGNSSPLAGSPVMLGLYLRQKWLGYTCSLCLLACLIIVCCCVIWSDCCSLWFEFAWQQQSSTHTVLA